MTNRSERIAGFCHGPAQHITILVVPETGSTNADLLAGIADLHGPTLLIADAQTAGRGRAGRTWHSSPDASLTFSLAWKFGLPLQSLVGLPLAVGVALAEALATLGVHTRLKWPNDVLYDESKLAGILIETVRRSGPSEASWAVIGIGINLAPQPELAERIGRPVAALPLPQDHDRDRLMAVLLDALAQAALQFEAQGMQAFTERWNALHAHAGRQVAILDQGNTVQQGIAIGVDASGRFLLDTPAGRVAVIAGDVSLRVRES